MKNKLREAPHLGWAKLEGQEQFHFYTRHRKNVCRGQLLPRGANPYFMTTVDPGQPVCPGCANQVLNQNRMGWDE